MVFVGGFDGLDGFDGGVVGLVEADDSRAQKLVLNDVDGLDSQDS